MYELFLVRVLTTFRRTRRFSTAHVRSAFALAQVRAADQHA
jgi:hypothetical protein